LIGALAHADDGIRFARQCGLLSAA
jgi:hypothetical protein